MRKKFIAFQLLLGATALPAHEYVLLAYKYVVREGDRLELHLFVADGFNIQLERPVQKTITKRFGLLTENGMANLLPGLQDGAYPVLDRVVDFKGLGLLYMERDYARIVLPNAQFRDYLKEDNIEGIQFDDSAKPRQSERYTRYIKALVQSNRKAVDTLYKAEVGQKLEIVLLDNPYERQVGDWLHAQLLFMGKPLGHKAVTARNRVGNKPVASQYVLTDADGAFAVKLEREGDWFLHTTHMIPCPDPDDADWESFWVTYSFGIAGAAGGH